MEAVDVVRRAGVDHPATSLPSAPDAAALAAREELNRITREVHEWELERELELERMRRKRAARRGGSMALSKLSEYDTAHDDRDSDSGSDKETEAGTTGGRRPPELVATNPGDSISSSDGMSSEYCANDLEELHHPVVVRGAYRPFHEEGMVKEGKHDGAGVYAGSHIGVL
jgi:hypothetical protein